MAPGPEFSPELAWKRLIIDKALCGLQTNAVRLHEHLSVSIRCMRSALVKNRIKSVIFLLKPLFSILFFKQNPFKEPHNSSC
jgi:hypothetical protein